MKLYIADGTYCGTQVEAKAISKQFEAVEVPVDKAGLIQYINNLTLAVAAETVVDTVAALNTPSNIAEAFTAQACTPFDLDDAFEAAPLRHRLRLAVTAIDAADAVIPREGLWKEPAEKPEALADALLASGIGTLTNGCEDLL